MIAAMTAIWNVIWIVIMTAVMTAAVKNKKLQERQAYLTMSVFLTVSILKKS